MTLTMPHPDILTAQAMRLEARRRRMLETPGNVSELACDDKLQDLRNRYLTIATQVERERL